MKWRKIGKIFCADNVSEHMISYARIPVADHLGEGLYDIYFGARDNTNRERVFKLKFNIETLSVINVKPDFILDYGEEIGSFDDNGVTPCCLLTHNKKKYLYYAGWNIHVNIPFTNAIGLAVSEDGGNTYNKLFKGPVLDRTKDDHLFVAVNDVLLDDGVFKTWYLSCVKWIPQEKSDKPLHYYHIRYAESDDGINWRQNGQVAIDFKNEYEYAISTPRVIKEADGNYSMWYSYRAQKHIETYRIGYAESTDGISWVRKDDMAGIDISNEGWDSEMICYPYVFDYKGQRYMFYNGNDYGRTGFGLAVLEEDL